MTRTQPPVISVIDRVPDEVLHEIFLRVAAVRRKYGDHSSRRPGRHPLLPVVQVCRRFNTVASPLLVRDLHLRPTDESGAQSVLHLLKHPHLRPQVKSLTLDEREYKIHGFRALSPQALARQHDARTRWVPVHRWPEGFCSVAELEQLAQSAEEAYPELARWAHEDEDGSWAGGIRQRSPRAVAALVVAWATGLRELNLMTDFSTPREPGLWMLRLVKMLVGVLGAGVRRTPPPDVLTKLRCVSLISHGSGFVDGRDAAAFFHLPSLRVFKAHLLLAEGLTLDEADSSGSMTALQPPPDQLFPDRTSDVEELHLYRSFMSDNGLSVLSRSCRRLRVLILEWKWLDASFAPDLSSKSIAAAIRLHSSSLEKISIMGFYRYDPDNPDESDPGGLGDCLLLCDKLKSLSIDLGVLHGGEYYDDNSSTRPLSEVLPPGLTNLGLSILPSLAEVRATKDDILGLLRQCGPKQRFSRLKKIAFIHSSVVYMADQEIIALAEKAGVELTEQDEPSGVV